MSLVASTKTADFQPSDVMTMSMALDLDVSAEPAATMATASAAAKAAPQPGELTFTRDSRFIDFDAEGSGKAKHPEVGSLR